MYHIHIYPLIRQVLLSKKTKLLILCLFGFYAYRRKMTPGISTRNTTVKGTVLAGLPHSLFHNNLSTCGSFIGRPKILPILDSDIAHPRNPNLSCPQISDHMKRRNINSFSEIYPIRILAFVFVLFFSYAWVGCILLFLAFLSLPLEEQDSVAR